VLERRRWSRQKVGWSARLLIGEGKVIAAKAIDASLHGLRLALDDGARAAAAIRHGERCAVEVHVPDSEARFFRQGDVRYLDDQVVGLAITQPLPAALIRPLGTAVTETAAAAPRVSERPTASMLLRLRSLAVALRRR
jgi:hypothetical protein